MKIETSRLYGLALDWAVAKAIGYINNSMPKSSDYIKDFKYSPSSDWSQGGPIIERERIELENWAMDGWTARATNYTVDREEENHFATAFDSLPLIAAMRCYVASKLGDTVEIPEELV